MTTLFNAADVLSMEAEILAILPTAKAIKHVYFKSSVADYLYYHWMVNNFDTRIFQYCFPLIQALMLKKVNLLMNHNQREVFNILCLDLMESMDKYDVLRGSTIYSYATQTVSYRILDFNNEARIRNARLAQGKTVWETVQLDSEHDKPMEMMDFANLCDFLDFVNKLKRIEGPTANRIISSLLNTLKNTPAKASLGRATLEQLITTETGLPPLIIQNYLNTICKRYVNADLPWD